jgi:hypothetical protein
MIEHRGISRDGITCTDDDCKCHDPAQNPLHPENTKPPVSRIDQLRATGPLGEWAADEIERLKEYEWMYKKLCD